MPFTHDQFLDVFGRFNLALWPAVFALWFISVVAVAWLARAGSRASRGVAAILALHWAWSGMAYHLAFFAAVNPAARLFGLLFLFEAVCLAWLGVVRTRLRFAIDRTPRRVLALVFLAYSLLYPGITVVSGHVWPRVPLFGVPCPTMLFTAGMLLAADRPLPWLPAVVPILWGLVGGSAAFLLNMPADYALFLATLAVAAWLVAPAFARHRRPAAHASSGV